MSGPVSPVDTTAAPDVTGPPGMEVTGGRRTVVGGLPVVRSLPQARRRTVGAWCFVDHFGPAAIPEAAMRVGPHPHVGLHTVTWVLHGEVVHHDSLGSEQLIKPGQLNLMTAGSGVAHAEETPPGATGALHGLQLWVAQPDATRAGPAAFEHHAALPEAEVGAVTATILIGQLAGARSPARADTPLLGADLVVRGPATLPLDPTFEHALLVVDGPLTLDGRLIEPGVFVYLAPGRSEIGLTPGAGGGEPRPTDGPGASAPPVIPGGPAPAGLAGGRSGSPAGAGRALLLGGAPFEEPILMWWNFVARSREEMVEARQAWEAESDRFGPVESHLGRIPAPPPLWDRPGMQPVEK